jgi:hypothetical protein
LSAWRFTYNLPFSRSLKHRRFIIIIIITNYCTIILYILHVSTNHRSHHQGVFSLTCTAYRISLNGSVYINCLQS